MHAIRRVFGLALLLLALPVAADASGPRFVTGPPFFTGRAGVAIGWRQANLLYYTDPGDLSSSVNHQAADALVAAAAGVWNLPVASITVAQGGALAEHVSGQNVYLDTSGMVYPSDVMSSNAAAIPIAVIYDTDGSVTDLLLGSGASAPSSCRQNAVTENVDSFDPAGYILHAMIIVNGRCTGAVPELQLELQYQLMRVFGRVLGLAWSQTNDNVFTGTPTATYNQALHWPVMHPLDIICGPYTYQCLPSPFALRADDIASVVAVYPIAQNATPAAGKQVSLASGHALSGHVYFPTGEGMAGVNVLLQRQPNGGAFDTWYETSAVTGAMFRTADKSPFVTPDTSAQGSFGSNDRYQSGAYNMPYVPIDSGVNFQNVAISTEAVNPLYAGHYTLGPYAPGVVAPSGSSSAAQTVRGINPGDQPSLDFTIADAAPVCGNGQDGTTQAPIAAPVSGWWNGLLCGYGHASYVDASVRPARTFTIEVTALNEQGLATVSKTMPVLGLFAPTDQPGDLPSLGATLSAFQANGVGTTTIHAATNQLTSFSFGIADQRGDGRPDYIYQARLFYADSLVPAELPVAGGQFTIAGMGFRSGNAVTINGVAATVVSWTANSVLVNAPAMAAANATDGVAIDVAIRDLSTGATSSMSAALTYTGSPSRPNIMRLVTAPAGTVYVGDVASTPFAVQVLGPDGVTPVVSDSVIFSVPSGSAQFTACAGSTCTLHTDANGIASTTLTPQAAGTITVQATDGALSQSATFNAVPQTGSILIWIAPSGNLPVGVGQTMAIVDRAANNGGGYSGRAVTFSATAGTATFSPCGTAVCTITTDGGGNVVLQVTPTSIGPITVQAADGDVKSSISFVGVSNTDTLTTVTSPLASTYIGTSSGQFGVSLLHADGSPDQFETITFTAPADVLLYPCFSNICTISTAWSGTATVGVGAQQPGSFTIQATFGSLSQSATFTVLPHGWQFQILSVPSGNVAVGQTPSTQFAVQILQDGLTPVVGIGVALGGSQGQVALGACNQFAVCTLFTDSNGVVSSSVTPLLPGTIILHATFDSDSLSASFNATGSLQTMTVLQQPGAAGAWAGDTVQLSVQVTANGGGPLVNDVVRITIESGPATIRGWSEPTVSTPTDSNGVVTQYLVLGGAGTVTVLATDGTVSQTITFVSKPRPDLIRLVNAPASGGTVGTVAAIPFAFRVFLSDGVTSASFRSVTLSVTNGSAAFAGCSGTSPCVLVTDYYGNLSTAVTPLSSGTITLLATEGGGQLTASFTVPGPPADVLTLTASPAASLNLGATSTIPLAVHVTLPDGITPAAGVPITFSVSAQSVGGVQFSSCSAAICTAATDALGNASTLVAGSSLGAVTLVATATLPTGAQQVSSQITVVPVVVNQYSLTAQNRQIYLAEGAAAALSISVVAEDNSLPAASQPVHWLLGTGFSASTLSTLTDATGVSSLPVVAGPLAAAATSVATACAWTSVCAQFSAAGVSAQAFTLTVVSGGQQSVTGASSLIPVVVVVQDGSGHPVAGAPVNIYQTVYAFDTACPPAGRCPAAPALLSKATEAVSALDGTIALAPLHLSAVATQTDIALSAGTQGFVTAIVIDQP